MRRGTTMDDPELPVTLSVDEQLERSETMAAKIKHVEHLRTKKRDDAKATQALIDAELDELERLAETIMRGSELRKQGSLTFDQAEATAALAKVAEVAGDTDEEQPTAEPPPGVREELAAAATTVEEISLSSRTVVGTASADGN